MANYKRFDFKKLYFILYIILVLLFVLLLFKLGIFLFPFLIAIFISILTQPFSKFLQNKLKFSYKLATIVSIVSFIIIFTGLIGLVSLKLIEEIYNLSQNLEFYSNEAKILWTTSIETLYSTLGRFPIGFADAVKNTINNLISSSTNNIGVFINKLIGIITSIPNAILYTCITILATFFMSLDKTKILSFLEQQFPKIWLEKLYNIKREMFNVLGSYIKAQLLIMTICFFELLIFLNLFEFLGFGVKYPLIMSIATAIIDALPILGAGAILLPWLVISVALGNYKLAAALLFLYLLVLFVRQMLEPKLISQNLGVHPLITLISMYTGFKMLGISGFLVGPVVMIILKNVFSHELEVGFFKEIFGDPSPHSDEKNKEEENKEEQNKENNKYDEFIETKRV